MKVPHYDGSYTLKVEVIDIQNNTRYGVVNNRYYRSS